MAYEGESDKVPRAKVQYWREYKWFQVITSMFAWLQAISIVALWSPTTDLDRIMWELCLGGITGIPYTTLISEPFFPTFGSQLITLSRTHSCCTRKDNDTHHGSPDV